MVVLGDLNAFNPISSLDKYNANRPKQHATTGSGDLFRARLEQIINMKHELVQLAAKLDWKWLDSEIAPLCSDQGRPGVETRFVIELLLLKHGLAT